jgi:hypothetical protein
MVCSVAPASSVSRFVVATPPSRTLYVVEWMCAVPFELLYEEFRPK